MEFWKAVGRASMGTLAGGAFGYLLGGPYLSQIGGMAGGAYGGASALFSPSASDLEAVSAGPAHSRFAVPSWFFDEPAKAGGGALLGLAVASLFGFGMPQYVLAFASPWILPRQCQPNFNWWV